MPLLKGRFTVPLKVLPDQDVSAADLHVIDYTGEKFLSKDEYDKRVALYDQPIWTCQCTGTSKLSHQDAWESEQKMYKYLQEEFVTCYERDVLQLVHHSSLSLENLVDQVWRMLQQQLVIGEPVTLASQSDDDDVTGTIVKVDTSNVEQLPLDVDHADNSGSSKENETSAANSSTPKKWTHPKLLPYKYSIKLDKEEKVINGIPASDIVRQHKPPSKDLLRLFIRTNALRGREGSTTFTPWIVNEAYCRKYSLQSKFPDLLVSPDKIRDMGAKALEESLKTIKLKKKRKSTDGDKKKVKKPKLDPKQKTLDMSKSKQSTNSGAKNGSAKKKEDDDSDSDDDVCLAQLKKSPAKPPKINDNISLAELKRRLSAAQAHKDATKKKKKQQKNEESADAGKKTPKKVNGDLASPAADSATTPADASGHKKAMKQMTLFDMKGKKTSKPGSKPSSPVKGSKARTPVKKKKSKSPQKSTSNRSTPAKSGGARTPQKKTPVALPPIAARLKALLAEKAEDVKGKAALKQLVTRCAKELTTAQRKSLPADMKDIVQKRWEKIQEKLAFEKMTPAEKEKFLEKKREENKQKMSEKMKQKWKELNKRYEDMHIDSQPLPQPKIVTMPEGLPNELFGDVAMVTEFIACYGELFVPDDGTVVRTDELAKALVSGADGFAYLGHVLVILLQTLLQDGISEGNEELYTALSDIAVTPYTSSELVRLCLTHRQKDNGGENSDDESEDFTDDEQTEQLVEQLESSELHELPPECKLHLLRALCDRLLTSYSVQDYMNERQQEASELWKKKIALLKQKNVERKEKRQEKKQKVKTEEDVKDVKSATSASNTPKSEGGSVTLLQFYGADKQVDDDGDADLATIVKRRREMAKIAAEDKIKKEREEKIKRDKEAEESKKQREQEQAEKEYNQGTLVARQVVRQTPLGTDRNHSRYWLFHEHSTPGVYVEKGWAPKEVEWSVRPQEEFSDESDSDDSDSESEAEVAGDEQKKRSRRKNKISKRGAEKTVPHIGQNLWFVYDSLAEVDELIQLLHSRGVRESQLKAELTKHYPIIKRMLTNEKHTANTDDWNDDIKSDMLAGFKEELQDLEERLRSSTLGGVIDYKAWQEKLAAAGTVKDCSECLLEVQQYVIRKFLKGAFVKTAKKRVKINDQSKDGQDKEHNGDNGNEHEDRDSKTNGKDKEGGEKVSEEEEQVGQQKWVEAVTSCNTWSRLHVLMAILDTSIKWEKSAADAKCKICRKKSDDDSMLLCDECNQAFHTYCLRPMLLEIPEGEWYCPVCAPAARKRQSNEKAGGSQAKKQKQRHSDEDEDETPTRQLRTRQHCDYRMLAGEEAEEEQLVVPVTIEHETSCALCGADGSMAQCSTCPSVFHLDCHEPPLRHEPRSNWRCMQCTTGVRIKRNRTTRKAAAPPKRKRVVMSEDSDEESEEEERPARSTRTTRRRAVDYRMDDSSEDEEEEEKPAPKANRGTRSSAGGNTSTSSRRGESSLYDEPTEMEIVEDVINKLKKHKQIWPYREPVSAAQVPDYYDVIRNPMDLSSIESKCQSGKYEDAQQFVDDVALMLDNAELYNQPDSVVGKTVGAVEKYMISLVTKQLPHCVFRRRSLATHNGSADVSDNSINGER